MNTTSIKTILEYMYFNFYGVHFIMIALIFRQKHQSVFVISIRTSNLLFDDKNL